MQVSQVKDLVLQLNIALKLKGINYKGKIRGTKKCWQIILKNLGDAALANITLVVQHLSASEASYF